MTDEIAGMSSK